MPFDGDYSWRNTLQMLTPTRRPPFPSDVFAQSFNLADVLYCEDRAELANRRSISRSYEKQGLDPGKPET